MLFQDFFCSYYPPLHFSNIISFWMSTDVFACHVQALENVFAHFVRKVRAIEVCWEEQKLRSAIISRFSCVLSKSTIRFQLFFPILHQTYRYYICLSHPHSIKISLNAPGVSDMTMNAQKRKKQIYPNRTKMLGICNLFLIPYLYEIVPLLWLVISHFNIEWHLYPFIV